MATPAKHAMADVMTMWTATFLEVPTVTTQWSWGMGQQRDVEAAMWKGYDAWVRVAKTAIDRVYENPVFGDVAAVALDRTLRWQQWQQTIASTIVATIVPLTGLPTAAMVDAVHAEVQSLHARLSEQTTQLQALRAERHIESVEQMRTQDRPRLAAVRTLQTPAIAAARNEHQTGAMS